MSFELLVRLDDRADANGDDRSLTGIVTLPPHAEGSVVLPFGPAPAGLRGRPPSAVAPRPGDLPMPDVRGTVDARHIVGLHISGVRDGVDRTLFVGTPTLRAPEGARPSGGGPLADRFGQWIGGHWPEKVTDTADLRRRLADTARATASLAPPPTAGHWGGVAGPVRRATGFFRTARADGRWMLVTPDGHPFLSLGVDAVAPSNPTVVSDRAGLFEALPATGSPLAAFYGSDGGRRTYDVGAANLAQGLGDDWRRLWAGQTVARLKAWGFNTLGNWSDPALAAALPHVTFTDVEGASAMVPMGDRALVDPFDPRFAAVADAVADTMTAPFRDDPGLIGYFSGNELPWGERTGALTAAVLALGPDSPARQALVGRLRARYRTPAAWAGAWGLGPPAGWDAPVTTAAGRTAAFRDDAGGFEAAFADRYFATVATALKRHDPHHLYLGTRFAAATPPVVAACARWCDVLSFNVYGPTPEARAPLWRDLGKPVLIGEFHFGSLDRGSFWPGMQAVPREADRGPAYAAYLAAAVADPAIVGAHWYQYADEPLTGRPYDGENGHIGLVAVTDVPYGGFVEVVAAANRQAIARFAKALDAGAGGRVENAP